MLPPIDSQAFDRLAQTIDERGIPAALEQLDQVFVAARRYHELFEVLKMKVRHSMGLPLLYDDEGDDLTSKQNDLLERGLLDACRRVGKLFFEDNQPRQGWLFLQPVGDRELAKQLVEDARVDDENVDEIVEIALGEAAAPTYGFKLLLEHYGTCNAITTFDSQLSAARRSVRREIAEMLVDHLYREIVAAVTNHIAEQEGVRPDDDRLVKLIADRPWLFSGGSHHVDTTHLASVMRIGRIVESPSAIAQLVELAQYGSQLDEQFHFNSDPPFESIYDDHLIYYRALQGVDVETGVEHFRAKSKATDREKYGLIAAESFVDLLCRVGRFGDAIHESADLPDEQRMGIAPTVMEIAQMQGDYRQAGDFFRERSDLLAWSITRLQQAAKPKQ